MPARDVLDPAVERDLRALDAALAGDASDPALAAFVTAVRDARAVPEPAASARLNGRFTAVAHAPRRASHRRDWLRAPALAGAAAAVLVALVVVAGALSGGG